MLSLTRQINEEISLSGPEGQLGVLFIVDVKGDDTVVLSFCPAGGVAISQEVKRGGDFEITLADGPLGSVRVTDIIDDYRARLAFKMPREIAIGKK